MKKLFSVLLVCCMAFAVSCSKSDSKAVADAKQQLKAEAENTNAMLGGQEMGGMTMTCTFDGTNLIYDYIVDENYISMDQLQVYTSGLKSQLESAPGFEGIIKNLKVLDGKVIYNYTGKYSGRKITEKISF